MLGASWSDPAHAAEFSGAVSTDILHFPARVVVTAADCLTWADARDVLEELSGVSERPLIIPMTTTARLQQRYDHRLRIPSDAPGM